MSARVLAVEDTPSLRALLELSLAKAGYAVEIAEDGRQAVEAYEAGAHNAVVMDIQMPVMDGLTAVGLMREWEKRAGRAPAPILALTANTEPADLKRCLDAGFTAALRKPFAREELLAALARALGAPIVVTADPEFADLIPRFLENCRAETAAMAAALDREDFPAVATSCHKLIGAGASFGFQPLSEESRQLEIAAKKSDAVQARARLDAMSEYLRRVSVVYP